MMVVILVLPLGVIYIRPSSVKLLLLLFQQLCVAATMEDNDTFAVRWQRREHTFR